MKHSTVGKYEELKIHVGPVSTYYATIHRSSATVTWTTTVESVNCKLARQLLLFRGTFTPILCFFPSS